AMCLFLKRQGFEVEMLEEVPGRPSVDIRFNGIPADLKKTGSHNNIVKEAKDAIRKKNAEIVVFEFTKETPAIYAEIERLKQMNIKALYYFTGRDKIHRNY